MNKHTTLYLFTSLLNGIKMIQIFAEILKIFKFQTKMFVIY